ncbi:MAG: hypothetical protein GWP05_05205 [Anaerolineaceae bacterium]|nr:hypothetical protein [Anaerolineaceae bacterium]
MLRFVGRTALVCVGLFAMLLVAQWRLTKDERPVVRLRLQAAGSAPGGQDRWEFTICEAGLMFLDDRPSSLDELMVRIASRRGPLSILADDRQNKSTWRFVIDRKGQSVLDGQATTLAEFRVKLEEFARTSKVMPIRQVTVADVLAANLPRPVYEHVSLPGRPYRKIEADDPDEPEVVIKEYRGHPMFDDPKLMPETLKEYYPEKLPPVADRLPENPAVLRGIEGIGRYSRGDKLMVWRRATLDDYGNIKHKIGYPALVRFDWSGRLQPNLAWKWEVSNQNRVYTFWLRKGLKWSDGHPFTTEDILYVTEDCVELGASRPNWMQETDGSSMLYADDVLDWPALAGRILEQARSDKPSPGRQIWKVIDQETSGRLLPLKGLLKSITPETPPDEATREKIVSKLTSLFGHRSFYDPASWEGVDFSSELEGLRKKGFSELSKKEIERYEVLLRRADGLKRYDAIMDERQWRAGDVTRFNVLMFRAAYRDFVVPAVRERVKIEAVPDETGDTSYILRFTFKRPNSIFLEKTATFMFYLGLFNQPKHYFAKWHITGSKVLNVIDILDWEEFWKAVRKQAAAAGPSPGKRLWPMLSDPIKTRLEARLPEDDRKKDLQYKQEVVDDINRVLKSRDFYDAAAWSKVDFESELAGLFKRGYSTLQSSDRRRFRLLLKLQDFLRRGVSDLSDEEVFEFNLMMLRSAYDGDPKLEKTERDGRKMIAVDREDALNKQAQWRGKRTWWALYSGARKPNKQWNRHVPTLCPWRIVSEPEDMTVIAVRNPFYFKVDAEGKQLPYIDMIESEKVSRKETRLLKLRSGNVDMQSRNLEFSDYTALKQNEAEGGYEVRLWANDYCGEVTYWICQQNDDPEYRKLQADPRIRQALSLALNRQEMIDVVFQGLGTPAQFSVPEGSKYYNPRLRTAFIKYDPQRANKLLDDMGLDKRGPDGKRLLWSGRPLMLEVSYEAERPLAAVQLACTYWRALDIKILMKQRSGSIKWRLYRMGKYDIWVDKEGGSYFGPAVAGSFAPTHPAESVQFSAWAAWLRSAGREGLEPPERIKDLDFMWQQVIRAPTEQDKIKAWMALTDRAAWELPVLGISTSPGKVIYVHKNFKNVPRLALAGWIAHEPGNCNPEMFYIEQDK